MASTRNKNTVSDYQLEQASYRKQEQIQTNHLSVGTTYHPGFGLIGHTCPSSVLSSNFADVESMLFGIQSTNLVEPLPKVVPEIHSLKTLNIAPPPQYNIFPKPLYIEPNQRPDFH